MEKHYKRLRALSLAQLLLSVILVNLGLVDGIEIRCVYVSLMYSPCWVAALVSLSAIFFFVSNIQNVTRSPYFNP